MPVVDDGPAELDADDRPRYLSECWRCHHESHDKRNRRCSRTECNEVLAPPDLVIWYDRDRVVALDRPAWTPHTGRRPRHELGRAGEYGYIFRHHLTVSRRHAIVEVDASGRGWVEPIPEAPNGTFLNGQEIWDRTELRSGDVLRLSMGGPDGSIRRPSLESREGGP